MSVTEWEASMELYCRNWHQTESSVKQPTLNNVTECHVTRWGALKHSFKKIQQSEKISPTTSKTKLWVCDWKTEWRNAYSFTSCILGLATPNLRSIRMCLSFYKRKDLKSPHVMLNLFKMLKLKTQKKGAGFLIFRPIWYLYKPAQLLSHHPLNSERYFL